MMKIMTGLSRLAASFLLILSALAPAAGPVAAQNNAATVVVFVRDGCQHCRDEEAFLTKLQQERSDVAVRYFRLEDPDQRAVWEQFTSRLGLAKVTPITVIGAGYIVGFLNEETTGGRIRALVVEAAAAGVATDIDSPTLTEAGANTSTCPEDPSQPCVVPSKPPYMITLPLIGALDAQKYPLLVLSAILGFFDGFNPCAMWVLVSFLVILLQVGSRRKMVVFAGTFILAEAIMYGLILSLWYKTWDFVRLDNIVTPIVGVLSIGGGILFLREWWKKELECRVTGIEQRAKIRQKIAKLATDKFTLMTIVGILAVAFSVNIIEFACSIGIPQAFTKIIEMNQLPRLQAAVMLATYILFYMIDDLVVFGLALYGAGKLAATARYSRLSNLIGGIVMIVLGAVLIFKSQAFLF